MSFEQKLRDHLSTEASSLALPDRAPERAAGRAAQRRRTRRATVAAVAGTAVLAGAVAVSPQLLDGDDEPATDVAIAAPGAEGLVPTGPLDLSWRATDAGLSDFTTHYVDDDGRLFALSTSPGARWEDFPDGDVPRTLYRLGEDGTWDEVPMEGDRPDAIDMSGDDGLLYAISTGPGEGGGVVARLSASSDGGDTWATEDLTAPEVAVDPELWTSSRTMSVETLNGQTLALVSTTWMPDLAAIFPEMANMDPAVYYTVENREEGLVLVRSTFTEGTGAWGDPSIVAPTTTAAPDATIAPDATGRAAEMTGEATGEVQMSPPEDVRTVPWSEVGAEGIEATEPQVQVYRRAGEAWEELPEVAAGFQGLVGAQLVTSGDRFVVSGYAPETVAALPTAEMPPATALASPDGVTWTPLTVPLDGTLTSVGAALFVTNSAGDQAQVSSDGGVTWSEVDLAAAGVRDGQGVMGIGGGPLGVALTIGDTANWEARSLAVSGDLADWTVTPIADVFGGDFPAGAGVSTPVVGDDTIALTRSVVIEEGQPAESVTVVGTPAR